MNDVVVISDPLDVVVVVPDLIDIEVVDSPESVISVPEQGPVGPQGPPGIAGNDAGASLVPSDITPLMDGAADHGTSLFYSRGDHRHPTDTSRAPLASPVFTGNPTAPTPTPGDNDTSVATTAFVANAVIAAAGASPSNATPLIDGTATAGASALYARGDHVHPTDTSRAPLASPVFTGNPTAPTPTVGDNDTSVATTAFVSTAIAGAVISPSNSNPSAEGVAAPGTSAAYSRGDHIHPADTFTQSGTGAVSRTPQNKMRESVSVKDFGAVGDGVTNDAAAIQAAVTAVLTAGGGRLFVPGSSGNYICNSQIVIDARLAGTRYGAAIQIVGEGPKRSCFASTTIATSMFKWIGDIPSDESHFRMENLRLTGNPSATVAGSIGLELTSGAWMTFDRCDLEAFDHAVYVIDIDQIAFYNCNIRFNNRGVTGETYTFTYFNSWSFYNVLLAGNKFYGCYLKYPNSFSYFGGSVQANGRIGAGGGSFGIGLEELGGPGAAYGTALFSGMAFESNGGLGDVVSIQDANPGQVSFHSVSFFRSVPAITTVTGAVNNGAGLIRLTVGSSAQFFNGQSLFVGAVGGVPNAIGQWAVTVIDATHIDLQGSTFAGTYTSGGIVTYMGYGINNIYTSGANASTTYKISGCTFIGGPPYAPNVLRPVIGINNVVARWVDDGTNYYANAIEMPTFPDAQLLSLGAKNGPWVNTTPAVTPIGGPGTFAATCVMRTLVLGKLVTVEAVITITNIGTATGFSVPFPVTPQQAFIMSGASNNAISHLWASASGQIFRYDSTATPVATTYYFNGSYEAA